MRIFLIVCCVCLFVVPVYAQEYTVKPGQEAVPDSEKIIVKTEEVQEEIDLKWFQEMLENKRGDALRGIIAYNDFVAICNAIIDALSLDIPHKKYAKVTLQDTRPAGQ